MFIPVTLNPFTVDRRPTLGKCLVFRCCHKWLFKKNPYCLQDGVIIVGLGIDFENKCFPLFLHSSIIGKTHNLLKLFEREAVLTV